MNSRGTSWLVAILQLAALTSLAQYADTIPPAVNFHITDNVSGFNADLRPLHRIAGAPKPSYGNSGMVNSVLNRNPGMYMRIQVTTMSGYMLRIIMMTENRLPHGPIR